ncbi:hypothetical protein PAPYR_7130 [Paratrimastix pyriformis]|uniref:Uncharacterized protein n=1 Tax=Paratrimastix pyriformis TaxID=342808 RepID=A0ABQ8UDS9_9EUKA|nr:hypothetical protein PAPYR_7130 [Paratrimastix pyriformis]
MDTSKEPRKSKGTHRRRAAHIAQFDDETEEIVAICAAVMSKMTGKQVLYDAAIIQAAGQYEMSPLGSYRRIAKKAVKGARDEKKEIDMAVKVVKDRLEKERAEYLKSQAKIDAERERMARNTLNYFHRLRFLNLRNSDATSSNYWWGTNACAYYAVDRHLYHYCLLHLHLEMLDLLIMKNLRKNL